MICSNCNAWVPDDSLFCPECGQKFDPQMPAEPAPQEAAPAKAAPAILDKVKEVVGNVTAKVPAKFLKIGAAAVALILVIAIVSSLFAGPKTFNYALYIQDGEVMYAEMPKAKKPVEVTSKFLPASAIGDMSESGYYFYHYFKLSSDGKKLFYADKLDTDGWSMTFTLYYRDITNAKKEPVKLESGLSGYAINEKGTIVTYLKDGKLYQHDLKEKTKIESDVTTYLVSEDGKTLLYIVADDDDSTLYLKKGNKEATKVASDVTEIHYVDEKMSTVIYSKEEDLYTQKIGKDATKIASDVENVLYIYESGEMYYTVANDEELTMWDLIDDDYDDKDDWDYEWYSNMYKEESAYFNVSTLCYYNGKESKTVSESMVDWRSLAYENPVIVYTALDGDELPSVSLTKIIEGEVSIYEELSDYKDENTVNFLAAKEATEKLALEDVYSINLTNDGKTAYACADYDSDDGVSALYQLTLNGAKVKKSEKIDEDVCRMSVVSGEKKNHVVYFKDVDDDEGELYMDGKHIDDDVYVYGFQYNYETDNLYYMVDWDSDDEKGNLKYSNGKKSTAVKDDVHTFLFTPEGECLFLYDFSMKKYEGELWIQNGKKVQKIAEEVAAIIPVY